MAAMPQRVEALATTLSQPSHMQGAYNVLYRSPTTHINTFDQKKNIYIYIYTHTHINTRIHTNKQTYKHTYIKSLALSWLLSKGLEFSANSIISAMLVCTFSAAELR